MDKNTVKRFAAFAAAATIVAFSLTSCAGKGKKENTSSQAGDNSSVSDTEQGDNNGGGSLQTGDHAQEIVSDKVKDKDLDDSFDDPDAVITLSGDSASVSGSGAEYKNGEVVISQKGVYVFSGTLNDGRIVVNAEDEKADIKIVLNGVDIASSDGCVIYGQSADKVIITLPEGSSNTISDAQTYAQSDSDAPNACVFADCDLTINGSGSLAVNGNYNNGIVSKDDLVLVNGSVSVTAANNGMKGKDSITVCDGYYVITSDGDGIKSDNSGNADKGWIVINGGIFDITCGGDGIQAEAALSVTAGTVKVTTRNGKGDDDSAKKGIKSGADMYISGGEFILSTTETCVKSSGAITIDGGSFTCSATDGDGVSAVGDLTVNDGEITVTDSDEGLESKAVLTINGGNIHLKASDDGMNAGNSSDDPQADHEIFINGGYVYIDADGDGIDSNGNITITGGTIVVAGPTDNRNGALDCGDWGNSITVSGGTLIAIGDTGMMEVPDSASTQYSIYTTQLGAPQGETVTLADESGNVIASYTVPQQAQGIVISSPGIEKGKTYNLYTGGELSATANDDGVALEGSISGGNLIAGGEITEITTSFGGSVGQGGFGGGGHGGGRGDRENFEAGFPDDDRPAMERPDGEFPGGNMPDGGISDMMPSDGEMPAMDIPDKRPGANAHGADISDMMPPDGEAPAMEMPDGGRKGGGRHSGKDL